jgi:hypothetical protein
MNPLAPLTQTSVGRSPRNNGARGSNSGKERIGQSSKHPAVVASNSGADDTAPSRRSNLS